MSPDPGVKVDMSPRTPLRVLVIEDDPDTRENLAELLELDGHECVSFGSFRETAAIHWQAVDAIILDRRLPDGDATEILPSLRLIAPQCPIVVVTGYPDVDGAIAALREGAYDYILKPISPDALRASLRRIDEQRRTNNELRRQRDFAESLIETAQAIVLVLDTEGLIVRVNPYCSELTGFDSDACLGKHWLTQLIPAADHRRLEQAVQRILQGETISDHVSRLRSADGTEQLINWSAKTLDGAQMITGLLFVGHNVTELHNAQKKLVQSERLAAIGQMIAGLAHESRNAFQRSQACLEMLMLELKGQTAALELVQRIQRAQDHLHHIYEEVRVYAAPIHLNRASCSLPEVWRETWQNLDRSRASKDIQLIESIEGDLCYVHADHHAMQRVFRNLFENAVGAIHQKGAVYVKARLIAEGKNKQVEVAIRDTGCGIAPEAKSQIFEPFFTTKTTGTGLGLPITKRLIEAHSGCLQLGAADGGTEMIFRLPLAEMAASVDS